MLRWNADAGIRDFDRDIAAANPGRHGEPAALRHGIARIQEEIEKHLLQLVLLALDEDGRFCEFAPDLYPAGSELVLEQRQHIADDDVYVDGRFFPRRRSGK